MIHYLVGSLALFELALLGIAWAIWTEDISPELQWLREQVLGNKLLNQDTIHMNILRDVRNFHKKFGLITQDTPVHLTRRKLRERVECLQEELNEFEDACQAQNLELQVDAMIDLIYFALGTLVMLGVKPWLFKLLWDDVQRANMSKVRGITQRGHAVDVKKPEGWVGPKGRFILTTGGYRGYQGEDQAIDDQASSLPAMAAAIEAAGGRQTAPSGRIKSAMAPEFGGPPA